MKYTIQFQKTDTLNGALNAAATSATLTTGNFGSPTGKQLLVVDYDVAAKREVILCTIAGTAITSITRAQDGTADVTHATGANVMMAWVPSHNAILADAIDSGWVEENANETWVYASASTFTIASIDVTSKYQKGTKLRFKQGGGYKYAIVASSSFATNTTVTIIVNTDYTIANSAITDNAYSYIEQPQAFPADFNYTVTYGGNASMTYTSVSTTEAKYTVKGNYVFGRVFASGTVGGTPSTDLTFTAPVARVTTANSAPAGSGYNNNAAVEASMAIWSGTSTTVINVRRPTSANWSAGTAVIGINFVYAF